MTIEILMPALSPTMEEGTLAKWLVKEGDTVASGDVMCEIETDKATMEFEAVDEGIIGKILVPEGTEGVKVNAPIAVLLEEGETADSIAAPSAPKAEASARTTPVGGSDETAPVGGSDETAPVGGSDKTTPSKGAGRGTPDATPAPAAGNTADGNRIFASPLARRIAAQKGLDLGAIKGSGPHGRIVKADVEGLSKTDAPKTAGPVTQEASQTPAKAAPSGPTGDAIARMYEGRTYEVIALDGMRKTIAARLTEAKQTVPHFYLRRDIQLDALMSFRAQLNKQLAPRGVKLSVNDFIIKACALALQQVPAANAIWAGDKVFQFKASDVAVAVAIEGGLFTPVLRDAEMKSLSALSAQMKDLAARARDRKLAPHEYQGGSFAISNLGMFGIDNFDAVINPPHGAILAVGAGIKKPVVDKDGELAIATVMSVTLSVDHRVIDGALGAELLTAIKDNLEAPLTMLA